MKSWKIAKRLQEYENDWRMACCLVIRMQHELDRLSKLDDDQNSEAIFSLHIFTAALEEIIPGDIGFEQIKEILEKERPDQ